MQNSCISFIILLTLTSVLFTIRSSYMASLSRMRLYTKIRVNEYLASIILTRSHTWGDKHNCIITQIGEACHIQNSSSMFVSKDYKHFKLILYLLFLCWILFRSISTFMQGLSNIQPHSDSIRSNKRHSWVLP